MFWLLFVLVVLLALIVYAPPKFIIDLLANRDPNVLFRVKTNKKIVGLTIDDGPSENTPNILRVLKKYNVKATFFVIGSQIENHRDVIKQYAQFPC
jgi:peptidoglycan/xylan/chitin deacetylase (PgdA/CDA1 family)